MIAVLAGGVGAARFLEGIVRVVPPQDVTIISNTADDERFFGLHVSPDIDIVIYTLADAVDESRGWGLRDDTDVCLQSLQRFGYDAWFHLGDADLATHAHRTQLLRTGRTLSDATRSISESFGLRCRLLPMSDSAVRTRVLTAGGEDLAFQDYFVRRGFQDEVKSVRFAGVEAARPAPGVLEALREAQAVLIAPSNPVVSIGPILAVGGIREALRERQAPVVAVSPIVGGRTLKGPADRMMAGLGFEPGPAGVAAMYRDFLDALVMDEQDRDQAAAVEATGVRVVVAQTVMRGIEEKEALGRTALAAAGVAL